MVQRLHPHPYLALFNGPDTSVTTRRPRQLHRAAAGALPAEQPVRPRPVARFAQALLAAEPDPAARLRLGLPPALFGRPPTEAERARALAFLERYEETLADEGVPAARERAKPGPAWPRILLASNEFLYVD